MFYEAAIKIMGGISEDMDKDIELKDEKIDFLAAKEEISAEKLRADMGKLNFTEPFAAQRVGALATVTFRKIEFSKRYI